MQLDSKWLFLLALIGLLAVPSARALAQDGASGPAPDFTQSQTLYADVQANGNLQRSNGATGVTKLGPSAGTYEVRFSRDVTACAHSGTMAEIATSVTPTGEITVVGRAGVPNGVFVQTFASNGVVADRNFHLSEVCP